MGMRQRRRESHTPDLISRPAGGISKLVACRPEGNADIYVVSAEGGQPRRLTTDPAEDIVPSWSRDGRRIYFTSNRSGRLQIWKMPAGEGDAAQMTRQGGFEPME